MKAFKPSANFVSRVMDRVYAYETLREKRTRFVEKLIGYWPLRWAMSAGGVFCWVLLSPTVCI